MIYQLQALLESGQITEEQLQHATILSNDIKNLARINEFDRTAGDLTILLHYYSHKRQLEAEGYKIVIGRPTGDEFLSIVIPPNGKTWESTEQKHQELVSIIDTDTQELFAPHLTANGKLAEVPPELIGKHAHLIELNAIPPLPRDFQRSTDFHEYLMHYIEENGNFNASPLDENVISNMVDLARKTSDFRRSNHEFPDSFKTETLLEFAPGKLRSIFSECNKYTHQVPESLGKWAWTEYSELIDRLATTAIFDEQFGRRTIFKEAAWKEYVETEMKEPHLIMISPYFIKTINKEQGRIEGTRLLRKTAGMVEEAETPDAYAYKGGASFYIAVESEQEYEKILAGLNSHASHYPEPLPSPIVITGGKLEEGQTLDEAVDQLRLRHYFHETMTALNDFPYESKIKFLMERLEKREHDVMVLFMLLNTHGVYDLDWREKIATDEEYSLPHANVIMAEVAHLMQEAKSRASTTALPVEPTQPS